MDVSAKGFARTRADRQDAGAHGQPLARLELPTVFSSLFDRIPALRFAVSEEEIRGKGITLSRDCRHCRLHGEACHRLGRGLPHGVQEKPRVLRDQRGGIHAGRLAPEIQQRWDPILVPGERKRYA